MADINEVIKNLTNKNGLLGALLAWPTSELFGTLIFKGRKIKNKIHHIKINIKTWVNIAIKIWLNELQFLASFEMNF